MLAAAAKAFAEFREAVLQSQGKTAAAAQAFARAEVVESK